jgi:probable rRNA maturation factor
MIEIQKITSNYPEIHQEMIKSAVLRVLALHEKTSADITIRLTDDKEMCLLNEKFRGISTTTDVLSFNQNYVNPETGAFYLGDIVISLDRACQQAGENNHTLSGECTLLAIHGALHLLGYDHSEPDEQEEMWKIQEKILNQTLTDFTEVSL